MFLSSGKWKPMSRHRESVLLRFFWHQKLSSCSANYLTGLVYGFVILRNIVKISATIRNCFWVRRKWIKRLAAVQWSTGGFFSAKSTRLYFKSTDQQWSLKYRLAGLRIKISATISGVFWIWRNAFQIGTSEAFWAGASAAWHHSVSNWSSNCRITWFTCIFDI